MMLAHRSSGVEHRRVVVNITLLFIAVFLPTQVRAEGGAVLAETSRAAGLAGAVTATPGDLSALYFNPGGLADIDQTMVNFSSRVSHLDLWFARNDETPEEMARWVGGFGLGVAAPLDFVDWLEMFRLGFSLYLPAQHALKIEAPERNDEPTFPLYGSRLEHISIIFGVAADIMSIVSIGASVAITPELYAPNHVRYVAGRGDTPDENVVIDIERELRFNAAFSAGIRVQPLDLLSFGVTFRQKQTVRAFGANDTTAGVVEVTDDIDFYDFWSPDELAFGLAFLSEWNWSLSADLVWSRWSAYRTIHNAQPTPTFDDTFNIRGGFEWAVVPSTQLRFGYGYEPSPISDQSGDTNLLDANRHVLALGAGIDFEELLDWSVVLDLHFRTHLMGTQRATKDVLQLTDSNENTPEQEINNLGYPSFEASGFIWQAGFTLQLFFGGDPS